MVDMPHSTLDKEMGKALVSTLKKAVNTLLEKEAEMSPFIV